MPLPTPLSKEQLQEIFNEVSATYDALSKLARDLDSHAEFDLLTATKRTAGSVWSLRKKIAARKLTAKPLAEQEVSHGDR